MNHRTLMIVGGGLLAAAALYFFVLRPRSSSASSAQANPPGTVGVPDSGSGSGSLLAVPSYGGGAQVPADTQAPPTSDASGGGDAAPAPAAFAFAPDPRGDLVNSPPPVDISSSMVQPAAIQMPSSPFITSTGVGGGGAGAGGQQLVVDTVGGGGYAQPAPAAVHFTPTPGWGPVVTDTVGHPAAAVHTAAPAPAAVVNHASNAAQVRKNSI